MRTEPLDRAEGHLSELAEEVASNRGRVVLTRAGRPGVVLLSLDELESLEETLFWLRDEAERAVRGEPAGRGEDGPGMSEEQVRARFAHLLERRNG